MGNPKQPRRKYDTPSHPWQGDRIKLENDLIKKFGLKNKREVWKSQSILRNFRQQARLLNARLRMADIQAEKERTQLLNRLINLGLLSSNSNLNDVLGLEVENILNRRLQTQVYLKGLAHTPKQARQFIVHGHISISGRKVTIPGYLVKNIEEDTIEYNQYSSLTNELHPMRPKPKVEVTIGDGQVSRLISIDVKDNSKSGEDTGAEPGESTPEKVEDSPAADEGVKTNASEPEVPSKEPEGEAK
ncbi:30S ribosomal protein S4 [[Eubacterium] cellulosolvens]